MYRHSSNCLAGPVSPAFRWRNWTTADDEPIRFELVQRIRREIAAGTYDTPEKWEATLTRLFQHFEDD
jgi:hypothetical protein